MKSTVFYPANAIRFEEKETSHIAFPFEKEAEFEEWCKINNFGWDENSIQGIIKSDCHVFWDTKECPVNFQPEISF